MKVGLIGAGRIGRIHAENIAYNIPRVTIARIADVAADKVRDWAGGLGVSKVSADFRDILADPEIGAVLICSSTDTHADIVMAAAEKGKHIFCEKPVDLTVAKVKKALAAAHTARVTLQVASTAGSITISGGSATRSNRGQLAILISSASPRAIPPPRLRST